MGTLVLPLGVSQVTVTVMGGGSSDWGCTTECAARGDSLTGTFPVTPGATLTLSADPQEMCAAPGGAGSVTGGGLRVVAGGPGGPGQPGPSSPEDGAPLCTDGGVGPMPYGGSGGDGTDSAPGAGGIGAPGYASGAAGTLGAGGAGAAGRGGLSGGAGANGFYGGGGGGAAPYCVGSLGGSGGDGSSGATPAGTNVNIQTAVSCIASASVSW